LLHDMNSYMGNLWPGHASTNRVIGSRNDLRFDDVTGALTPRSAWIHSQWPDNTPLENGKIVSSVTDPSKMSVAESA